MDEQPLHENDNIISKSDIVTSIVSTWRHFSKIERQALTAIACGRENRGCTLQQVVASIIEETNANRLQLFVMITHNFEKMRSSSRELQALRMLNKIDRESSPCLTFIGTLSFGLVIILFICCYAMYQIPHSNLAFMR